MLIIFTTIPPFLPPHLSLYPFSLSTNHNTVQTTHLCEFVVHASRRTMDYPVDRWPYSVDNTVRVMTKSKRKRKIQEKQKQASGQSTHKKERKQIRPRLAVQPSPEPDDTSTNRTNNEPWLGRYKILPVSLPSFLSFFYPPSPLEVALKKHFDDIQARPKVMKSPHRSQVPTMTLNYFITSTKHIMMSIPIGFLT
jgi:hypothetical protein